MSRPPRPERRVENVRAAANSENPTCRVPLPPEFRVYRGPATAPPREEGAPTMPHRIIPVLAWFLKTFDPWYGWAFGVGLSTATLPLFPNILVIPLSILAGLILWNFVISTFRRRGRKQGDPDEVLKKVSWVVAIVALQMLAHWSSRHDVPGLPGWLQWAGVTICVCSVIRELRKLHDFAHIPGISPVFEALESWTEGMIERRVAARVAKQPPPPAP